MIFFKNSHILFFRFHRISLLIFSLLICAITSSCFTGIESTKKISLSREERRNANPTPEERFLEGIKSSPLKDWQEGKRFIVSDNKALLVIVPQKGLISSPPDSIKGEILKFAGVEPQMNAAGDITLSILFSDGTYLYAYSTGKEFDVAMEDVQSDQIPMLIDEGMVAEARQLLKGNKFWSRSNLWYDQFGNRVDGRKYVEVEIVDVFPGDMVFPLKLQLLTTDGETAFVFMNFGSGETESRSFNNLFSLSDIRKHYPAIESETWNLISRGQVKEGMTKEEVKLSLGNPRDINSGHDYSQTLDIWTYDNGKVLWFEDGRLSKIRQ